MVTSSIQDILMIYVWEDDKELSRTQDIIDYGKPKLFNFDYPLYDTRLKSQFEADFIRHFYTREIGSESIALFKLRLQDYLTLNHEKWHILYRSMDDSLNPFNNIDLKTIRSIDESEQNDRDKTAKDKEIGQRANKDNEKIVGSQDTTVTSHADDFTRNLEEDLPDERLTITANDGVGLVEYASNIAESKNTNDSTQTSGVDSTTTNVRDGLQDTTRDVDRTELENQLRAFEQQLEEHKIGRTMNKSFVEIYDEYIKHFQGLHRLMFKDMEKLFLGVF